MPNTLPFAPIHPIEPDPPELLSFSGRDDLGVWRYRDGTVVIRIGPATEIGAEAIALERHQIGPVWRSLKAIDDEGFAEPPEAA